MYIPPYMYIHVDILSHKYRRDHCFLYAFFSIRTCLSNYRYSYGYFAISIFFHFILTKCFCRKYSEVDEITLDLGFYYFFVFPKL
jgi:hypothetical protein